MKEQGQSLLEFGIAFLFLMFLLSGIVELGVALFQYVQLRDAAQEGAIFGSFCQCGIADIEKRVRGASSSPIDLVNDSVSIEVSINGGQKDVLLSCEKDALQVNVIYPHKIFMPFLPMLLGRDNILLNASATNTMLVPIC